MKMFQIKRNMLKRTFDGRLMTLLLVCVLAACGNNRQARLEKELCQTVSQYLTDNLPVGTTIDSVRILHIDSLSDYSYLLFVEKPVAENYLEGLHERYASYPEEGTTEEMLLRQQTGDEITRVINWMDRKEELLRGNSLDTANLKCFFVAVRVFMKQNNQVLEPEYYGFPITPDFEVLESEAISY